jgi:hypothetical protein
MPSKCNEINLIEFKIITHVTKLLNYKKHPHITFCKNFL